MSSPQGIRSVSGMNLDGASDSPPGSRRGSQSGSRPGSNNGGSPPRRAPGQGSGQPNPFGPGIGFDPARDPNKRLMTEADFIGKRVDLPPEAYNTNREAPRFAARPGLNSEGKPIKVQLNIFNVQRLPRGDIFQYDVTVSPNEKNSRALVKKVWNSNKVQNVLERASAGGKWLYDGNKLAWSSKKLPKDFFDHVMRQNPSEQLISIKRNFYSPQAIRRPLENYLEVIKGTYAAFRLSDSILRNGTGFSVNVDISNTTFWQCHPLSEIALLDMLQLAEACKPEVKKNKDGLTEYDMSEAFKLLHRRMIKLKFQVNHRGKIGQPKIYTVKRLVWEPRKYGAEGGNARTITFEKRQPDGTTTPTSVFKHFMDQYNIRLRWANMPIIETTRGAFFPLEVCNVASHQRYQFKLDPQQTAAMIKIAVTRPNERKKDIMDGVRELNWNSDQYLRAFDLPISQEMVVTNARLLQNPEITYANKKENPGLTGRWDLRGKKFWKSNQRTLSSWGMVAIGDACTKQHLEAFSQQFCQVYRGHGGNIDRSPILLHAPYTIGDYGKITEFAYRTVSQQAKEHPSMIFFILANKNQLIYERIKKNMDCRWCVVSQCLQGMHVKKNQGQYCSNVAMKVNAKLGGTTCKIAGPNPNMTPFFQVPTMMIGLDVTHAAPGSGQPSMAAMTVSTDRHAAKYVGRCEVNGWRTEILLPKTTHVLFPKLLAYWCKINNTSPRHVYYFRDGVSDGQFQYVIDEEVKALKQCFREKNYPEPQFTVIIATKRHHIRFFPKPGDRASADKNNNPLPGTLVEQDATHPFHFDFYLCSHVAIQGTARPVHYNVIHDEYGVKPNLLQKMIYQQCYQYCRSTTPVSLHPAVYYSHLASQRARSHEDIAASQKEMTPIGKQGFPLGKQDSEIYSGTRPSSPPPLLPMEGNFGHFFDFASLGFGYLVYGLYCRLNGATRGTNSSYVLSISFAPIDHKIIFTRLEFSFQLNLTIANIFAFYGLVSFRDFTFRDSCSHSWSSTSRE
ncbi:hypothetical protein DL766_001866 [Monosporascus sp. MC13-8B]|uniref:Piwi domain-containing protein n=1 Tax=Monosporascus cannonballus TaxID=155416 RepID=A0ABY0H3M9_9PEZI|nr:hypothetical protein DL762_005870 [Monosporascus cannonballus]RYO87127.1 hypothetical protein DL763_006481 [Monosporascus cannonballus]RYP36626.1 hypothetical protein DL766_001866 [Monosporascus sp. MC13-8B]